MHGKCEPSFELIPVVMLKVRLNVTVNLLSRHLLIYINVAIKKLDYLCIIIKNLNYKKFKKEVRIGYYTSRKWIKRICNHMPL